MKKVLIVCLSLYRFENLVLRMWSHLKMMESFQLIHVAQMENPQFLGITPSSKLGCLQLKWLMENNPFAFLLLGKHWTRCTHLWWCPASSSSSRGHGQSSSDNNFDKRTQKSKPKDHQADLNKKFRCFFLGHQNKLIMLLSTCTYSVHGVWKFPYCTTLLTGITLHEYAQTCVKISTQEIKQSLKKIGMHGPTLFNHAQTL